MNLDHLAALIGPSPIQRLMDPPLTLTPRQRERLAMTMTMTMPMHTTSSPVRTGSLMLEAPLRYVGPGDEPVDVLESIRAAHRILRVMHRIYEHRTSTLMCWTLRKRQGEFM